MFPNDDSPPPSPLKEAVGRATLGLVGLALAYAGVRGLVGLSSNAQDWWSSLSSPRTLSSRQDSAGQLLPVLPWLICGTLAFLGALSIAAAVFSVERMQGWFERFNTPPVTGDRTGVDVGPPRWWWRWFGRR